MSAIFISHSSRDNEVAAEVRERLAGQGHRSIFLDFDPADGIPAGRSWEQELYARLKACQAIVVLCSEPSMASDWCFAEITHAKSLGKHVFPVKVAECEIRPLLTDFQVLDLTADREDAYARLHRGLEVAGLDPKNMFDWDGSRPPYPGLLAFQEEDAAIFFGRDAEIREGLSLLRRLERFGGARWTAVLGASGSGKSSLVRAGLLPRLARDREAWLATSPFRPLGRPFAELAGVLAAAFERAGAPRDAAEIERLLLPPTGIADSGALVRLARELRDAAGQARATVLLAVDQFEELLGTGDQATRFLVFLRAALDVRESPLRVLATLRSDFLGELQTQPALHELDVESLTVGPMSADGFAQVIEGPAALAGIDLGPGLVQAMVEDTRTEDALPLLAFALRELWEGYGGDARLEVGEYRDQLGGLSGAVALAAESVLAAEPLSERRTTDLRTAFVAMVRINEEGQYARRPAQFSELPASVHDVLERFVEGRLLVARGDGGERSLEVAHEALLRSWDRMVGWLEEDRAFLLWRRRLAEARREWERTERNAGALLRGQALAEAAAWSESRRELLGDDEEEFVAASAAAARRRRRWIRAGIAAAMLVLAVFAGWSHWQRLLTHRVMEMAHDNSVLTHSRSLRASAESPRDRELASRLLLNLHNPELALESVDLDALHRQDRILGASRDSMLVAIAAPAGEVDVTLVIDDRWSVRLPHDAEVYAVAIEGGQGAGILDEIRSARGRYVLTAADDLVVRLWQLPEVESVVAEIRDARLPRIPATRSARLVSSFDGHAAKVSSMKISGDGRFAVSLSRSEVALWRTDSGAEPLLLGGHAAAVTAAAFGPAGDLLLTTGAAGVVLIYDLDDVFAAPQELAGHRAGLISGAFSRDGADALTLSRDGEIWWWKLADGSGRKVATADCEAQAIAFADISGDAILACRDGTARVFDVEKGGAIEVLE